MATQNAPRATGTTGGGTAAASAAATGEAGGGPRSAAAHEGDVDANEHARLSRLAPTSAYGISDNTAAVEGEEARRTAAQKLVEDGKVISRSGMEDGENVIYVVADDGITEDKYVVGERGGVTKA